MASAFRCYTAFCELRKAAPFPVREEVVLQWSSMFNTTATFGNYVSLLEKCCFFFLHFPAAWKSPMRQESRQWPEEMAEQKFSLPELHSYPPSLAHYHA